MRSYPTVPRCPLAPLATFTYSLELDLLDKLTTGLYREALGSAAAQNITPLLKAVCKSFTDLYDLA